MTKKFIGMFVLLFCLSAMIFPTTAFASSPSMWSDDVAPITPEGIFYYVSSPQQLAWVAQQVNSGTNDFEDKVVQLQSDIDLSGAWWVPIGNGSSKFDGTFEGSNFTISNLFIIESTDNHVGLFGYVNYSGRVHNVNLEDVTVESSGSNIGAVIGSNFGAVSDIHVLSGHVSGNAAVGGIIGASSHNATVNNVSNNAIVSALVNEAGGIIGRNDGLLMNAVNMATVNADKSAGGIVGWNLGGNVMNVYSIGDAIHGNKDIGGIIGVHTDGYLSTAYNAAEVILSPISTEEQPMFGGVVGFNNNAVIEHGFYLDTSCEFHVGGYVEGNESVITTHEFTNNNGYVFSSAITIGNESGITTLIDALNASRTVDASLESSFKWVAGTDANPITAVPTELWRDHVSTPTQENGSYIINTANELAWIEEQSYNGITFEGDTIILTADIDLSAYIWSPIASEGEFLGTFYGGGHTISGLYIQSKNDKVGLFSVVNAGGVVQDVTLSGANIIGKEFVGGIVGHNYGTLRNVHVSGLIVGTETVGGIFGRNEENGSITYATTDGIPSGGTFVGGIGGTNSGHVDSVQSSSYVRGLIVVGGVVGSNNSTLFNASNMGQVQGDTIVGGIVADNSLSGSVKNIYNAGNLSARATESPIIGAIIGKNDDVEGKVSSGYWLDGITIFGGNTTETGVGTGSAGESFESYAQVGTLTSGGTLLTALNSSVASYNDALTPSGYAFPWTEGESASKPVLNIYGWSSFADGTGVESSGDFTVTTAEQLAYIAAQSRSGQDDFAGQTITLGANIDLSGLQWSPIGAAGTANHFKGIFDGHTYKISGLTMTQSLQDSGLFGVVGSDGIIENIMLDDVFMIGASSTGGLAGANFGNISNVAVHGTLYGNERVGGIIGDNYGGKLGNSYTTATVSGTNQVGAIVGKQSGVSSSLTSSFWLEDNTALGLGQSGGTVRDVHPFEQGGTFSPSITVGEQSDITSLVDALNVEKRLIRWKVISGYPTTYEATNNWSDYTTPVTPTDGVYVISTPEELAWFALEVDNDRMLYATVRLDRDIDLSSYKWNPIGREEYYFGGVFDGDNHKITGLDVGTQGSEEDYRALFAGLKTSGVVKNLSVSGTVNARSYISGVVGYNSGTIVNVQSDCDLISSSRDVGGIAGYNSGTILNVKNSGDIEGQNFNIGGIVGWNNGGTVRNAVNTGSIYGDTAGGIVGLNGSESLISNAYSAGNVEASLINDTHRAGAVAGKNTATVQSAFWLESVTITNGNQIETGVGIEESSAQNMEPFTNDGVLINAVNGKTSLRDVLNIGVDTYNTTDPEYLALHWSGAHGFLPTMQKRGDSTEDGRVDIQDLVAISQEENYNKSTTEQNRMLDLNSDGKINFADLAMARNSKNFGK